MRKLWVIVLLLAAGCATNPVTHKREFNIVSESQEIQLGEQSHQQIVRQFGVYNEKPELAQLVDTVGHRLAGVSERPNLPWHFTILDTPMVNAMALPGGFIYITRGMLERINSEDELAGVLGHEVTHVTARHAAHEISREQLAQFGMVLGSVVAGPAITQTFGQLAELGMNLLFQRDSRAQEHQADLVGTTYVERAGFNPVAMERMLTTLVRLDKHPATGVEKYFESHPDPLKRVADVDRKLQEIRTSDPTALQRPVERTPYVRMTDGIMTGNSTERVTIRGGTIFDREHGLIMQAPQGWVPTTAEGMLFAMTPRGQQQNAAFMMQEVADQDLQGMNAQDAVRNNFQQMGLQYAGSRQAAVGTGQQFVIDDWMGQTQSGPVAVESTQFPHADHVAVMIFLTSAANRYASPLTNLLERSTINLQQARSAQPARIRVETTRGGDTWQELARRATGNPNDAEEIANINGFDARDVVPPGTLVKLPAEVVHE